MKPLPPPPKKKSSLPPPPRLNAVAAHGNHATFAKSPSGEEISSHIGETFFDVYQTNGGWWHWSLCLQEKTASKVLAGHVGPNPKSREEALRLIEEFKQIVANSPTK